MYIVTGGAGFIGSAFVRTLNDKGIEDILVVDQLGSSEKWRNLTGKCISDYLESSEFYPKLEDGSFDKKIEAIIHLGACSSTTQTDAAYMMNNNYRASRIVADWALKNSVRLIYASSAATYGDGTKGFSDAENSINDFIPLNIYAYSKQLFDQWTIRTGAIKSMIGVKFFNVFGPNEYHKNDMRSVVHKAFHQIQETSRIGLFKSYRPDYSHGEQKRDFVYIKDCCEVLYWFLETPRINGIFNLGTGTARSWNDLAKSVFSALGKDAHIDYIEMPETLREKYQYFTEANMNKLAKAGCPVEFRSLEDAVKDYVQNHLLKENPYW